MSSEDRTVTATDGAQPQVADPQWKTIPEMFAAAATTYEDRLFLVGGGKQLTYGEVHTEARRLARGMAERGVSAADRVAVWMSNRVEWVIAQLATTEIGAVLVPLNTRLREIDLMYALRHSQAKMLFVQDSSASTPFDYLRTVRALLADQGLSEQLATVVVVGELSISDDRFISWDDVRSLGSDDADLQHDANAEDLAYILYTSGTTVTPKGVMLGHRSLNNAYTVAEGMPRSAVVLVVFPLFAITGAQNCVLTSLANGNTLVLEERFRPEQALIDIETYGVEHIAGPIQALKTIVEDPTFAPARVRTVDNASVLPRRLEHRPILEALGLSWVRNGYGMTETCGPVTSGVEVDEEALTHDGWPTAGKEIKIVDAEGEALPPGQMGEIYVRTPYVMLGYLADTEATKLTIGEDGWVRTGDLGERLPNGALRLIGRKGDAYKCNGFNVATAEVEEYLRRHATVRDAAVVAIPDPRAGEVGIAFVELEDGATCSPDSLIEWCQSGIASYKVPREVHVLEQLPRTTNSTLR